MAIGATAYHGEMGIDPDSGTILRLVLEADPDLGSSIRAFWTFMVEYGSVAIGEKRYTCPVRSVSISTGESPRNWGWRWAWPRCARSLGWTMWFSAITTCSARRCGLCRTEVGASGTSAAKMHRNARSTVQHTFLRSSQTPTRVSARQAWRGRRSGRTGARQPNPEHQSETGKADAAHRCARASMAATIRPRLVPSKPARALCSSSWASTRLALAGRWRKGKEKTTDHRTEALRDQACDTHTAPPNTKRKIHSWGLMPLIAASLAWTIMAAISP